jgi:hypothetical protein
MSLITSMLLLSSIALITDFNTLDLNAVRSFNSDVEYP